MFWLKEEYFLFYDLYLFLGFRSISESFKGFKEGWNVVFSWVVMD